MSVKRNKSTLEYVLLSLVPFSEPNLKLAFKPNLFFKDLEKAQDEQHAKLRSAYYRAIRSGHVEIGDDHIPRLTEKGRRKIRPFVAKKLGKDAKLMVIFDVPESERAKRDRLRIILHDCEFTKVQKSVWVSDYDYRDLLHSEISEQGLETYVQVYEANRLKR